MGGQLGAQRDTGPSHHSGGPHPRPCFSQGGKTTANASRKNKSPRVTQNHRSIRPRKDQTDRPAWHCPRSTRPRRAWPPHNAPQHQQDVPANVVNFHPRDDRGGTARPPMATAAAHGATASREQFKHQPAERSKPGETILAVTLDPAQTNGIQKERDKGHRNRGSIRR